MKVLFVMLNGGYVRNYEGVLRQLAAEGHQVHVAMEVDRNKQNENVLGQRLAAEMPNVTVGLAAVPADDDWFRAARTGRMLVDYLRYLAPQYRDATALRTRAFILIDKCFRPFLRVIGHLGSPAAAVVVRALIAAESAVPLSLTIMAYLEAQRPDVLLLTPLVEPGSIQVDYIKCARRLGIPTALCVASWDNLTNKGSMRIVPDRVFVWNEPQREEAVTLHRVPRARVTVTGAQIFDHWFEWKPSRTRDEFCRPIGLDPGQPFVLYLGSSFFIAPTEAEFGGRWIAALRDASDPVVAQAGILVRPHPSSGGQWHGLDLSHWHHAVLWPPSGASVFAPEFKYDFFDSLYHCSAVVGVNTSAQIEAAIVGKVVCTIQADDFAHSQGGTLHYQHLVKGGLLQVACTLEEHVGHLGAILRDPEAQADRSRRFVEYFVRPHGLDVKATPRLAAAILGLAATPHAKQAPSMLARAFRPVLLPLVRWVNWLPQRRPSWSYAMRPAVHIWVYFRLRPHLRAERKKEAAIRAMEVREPSRLALAFRPVLAPLARCASWWRDRRPWWSYALRPAVHVWVYFRVRPHLRAERKKEAAIHAKHVRRQRPETAKQQALMLKRAAHHASKAVARARRERRSTRQRRFRRIGRVVRDRMAAVARTPERMAAVARRLSRRLRWLWKGAPSVRRIGRVVRDPMAAVARTPERMAAATRRLRRRLRWRWKDAASAARRLRSGMARLAGVRLRPSERPVQRPDAGRHHAGGEPPHAAADARRPATLAEPYPEMQHGDREEQPQGEERVPEVL